jgi:periplasmic protein TonB
MFEDSLFASRVGVVSTTKRWTVAASVALQAALAAVVIVLPLLHPESLPFRMDPPKVLMPLMRKPPVPVVETRPMEASPSSVAMPGVTRTPMLPSLLPGLNPVVEGPPALGPISNGVSMGDSLPGPGLGDGRGHGPTVSVRPAPGPIHVSTGVSDGMLLAPIRPVYPAIARAARVEGTVVVEAVISRAGKIESLRVVSGPEMLRRAALDAIQEARYRPYRLNGEAVDVQTTITVNFRMGG